jgi:hypothetical protein
MSRGEMGVVVATEGAVDAKDWERGLGAGVGVGSTIDWIWWIVWVGEVPGDTAAGGLFVVAVGEVPGEICKEEPLVLVVGLVGLAASILFEPLYVGTARVNLS